ncbi:putative DTDP-glucose 4,6-dehydratase [Blastocladiella britannica]|nr:putative DTDP-glucose 4,6-dehydratase [Blastocladiella britannica]
MATPTTTSETRSVLVTGGAGFIGAALVNHLTSRHPHWRIVVLDKLDYCSSLAPIRELLASGRVSFVHADLTDAAAVQSLLRDHAVTAVVHLAAQSHVDNSFGNSLAFTVANVLGTHVLLDCMRAHGNITRFVHVSTDEVYGDGMKKKNGQADETALLAPNNPYSATKAAAECLVRAYLASYGIPAIITRSNNVYGPGQYPEKVIPKFICQLLDGQKCTLHGSGAHERRYLHVADVCRALDLILERGKIGEIYNIGTDHELSNLALATDLVGRFHTLNADLSLHVEHVADRAANDRRYAIDSSKLRALGWSGPTVAWDTGIQETIEWYRQHRHDWWGDLGEALRAHPTDDRRTIAEMARSPVLVAHRAISLQTTTTIPDSSRK